MSTTTHTFLSEKLRTLAAEHEDLGEARGLAIGKAEGEAAGERAAVLTVLESREIAVPAAAREQILACTDLDQLTTWLRRAITATTVDDVLHS